MLLPRPYPRLLMEMICTDSWGRGTWPWDVSENCKSHAELALAPQNTEAGSPGFLFIFLFFYTVQLPSFLSHPQKFNVPFLSLLHSDPLSILKNKETKNNKTTQRPEIPFLSTQIASYSVNSMKSYLPAGVLK